MKTAREIIAEAIETPPVEMPTPDMVIARLAAEGFSIVETGRAENAERLLDAIQGIDEWWDDEGANHFEGTPSPIFRARMLLCALSRSTREGKTE
jgi:hypothetical protein